MPSNDFLKCLAIKLLCGCLLIPREREGGNNYVWQCWDINFILPKKQILKKNSYVGIIMEFGERSLHCIIVLYYLNVTSTKSDFWYGASP